MSTRTDKGQRAWSRCSWEQGQRAYARASPPERLRSQPGMVPPGMNTYPWDSPQFPLRKADQGY